MEQHLTEEVAELLLEVFGAGRVGRLAELLDRVDGLVGLLQQMSDESSRLLARRRTPLGLGSR